MERERNEPGSRWTFFVIFLSYLAGRRNSRRGKSGRWSFMRLQPRRLFRHESKLGDSEALWLLCFDFHSKLFSFFFFFLFYFSLRFSIFFLSFFSFFFFALTNIRQSLCTVFLTNCKRRKFSRLTTLESIALFTVAFTIDRLWEIKK